MLLLVELKIGILPAVSGASFLCSCGYNRLTQPVAWEINHVITHSHLKARETEQGLERCLGEQAKDQHGYKMCDADGGKEYGTDSQGIEHTLLMGHGAT
jgi:hypothetical protein